MAESSFFARNKAAIALTVLASAGAVGAYLYYAQQQVEGGIEKDASGQKKSKKNKKKKSKGAKDAAASPEAAAKPADLDLTDAPFPVNEAGEPAFGDEDVEKLSEEQKEEWALALKNAGNSKYKNSEFEAAIAFYSAALKVKLDPVFYSNRSACYSSLGNHEAVINDATEAIKLKPDYTKCILRRATSYEELGNYPDAMFDLTALTVYGAFNSKSVEQRLEKVLQKQSIKVVTAQMENHSPSLPSAGTLASFFGAFVHETNPEGISEESTGADKFLWELIDAIFSKRADKYDEFDNYVAKVVAGYEDENVTADSASATKATIAYEYATIVSFLKGDKDHVKEYIKKAFDLKPRARTYVVRALITSDEGSIADLAADFEKALQLDPKNADSPYQYGQLHYLLGKYDEAELYFIKAKELNPDNLFAYIQQACVVYKKGQYEDAIKLFDEAKLRFPTSPEVLNYYGEILADRNETQAAIKQYDIAIRLQRDLAGVGIGATPLINKAMLLQRDGLDDKGEAAALFEKAVEVDPKSEAALIGYAQVKLSRDKAEEAIPMFEEASRLSRTFEEKVLATSFAEATKMQLRIKADPTLTKKMEEILLLHSAQALR